MLQQISRRHPGLRAFASNQYKRKIVKRGRTLRWLLGRRLEVVRDL